MQEITNFFVLCHQLIMEPDPKLKIKGIMELFERSKVDSTLDYNKTSLIASIPTPGRPATPELVSPLLVPKRKLGSAIGHASLIHAIAHIEFNAINLALDACYRFQEMPSDFYQNWLEVARDEAYHFSMLSEHLIKLGYHYGYFTAHNGLWDMAIKTEHDVLARMALVPRVLEARGLDAVPDIQEKIRNLNDLDGYRILDIIHQDEIKHVRYGDKWFKYLCSQNRLDPETTFFELIELYDAPKVRGVFNREDREKAGFSKSELDQLSTLGGKK